MRESDHVSLFFVPVLGLMFGFVTAWFAGAGTLLAAVLAYGLFGYELNPIGWFWRMVAAVFSGVFVVVTLVGWASWIIDRLSPTPPSTGAEK